MTTQIILTLLPKELAVRNNGGVLEVWVEQQSHPMNKSWQNSSGGYRRAMYSYRQGPDTQTSRRSNILCRVCCRQEKMETESVEGQGDESNCLPVGAPSVFYATPCPSCLDFPTCENGAGKCEKPKGKSDENLVGTTSTGAREFYCKLPVKILLTCQQQTSNAPWE